MAKQSGIHQLRGKVGGNSYYRQAGVTDGLMRKIPEGLSQAVKYGENYANARLNNAEFGSANKYASIAYQSVRDRVSTMFRRFAVAEMTRRGLEEVKKGTGDWGQRIPAGTFDTLMVDLLEKRAKIGAYDGQYGQFAVDSADPTAISVRVIADAAKVTELRTLGIDGFVFSPAFSCLAVTFTNGKYNYIGGTGTIQSADISIQTGDVFEAEFEVSDSASLYGMQPNQWAAAHNVANFGSWVTLAILPYRIVNGQKYVLRELCTYASGALGALTV